MNLRNALLAAMFPFIVVATQSIAASDWLQWNGSSRDGISTELGFADSWPESGLKAEWTREIGTGFSSMSIAGERLFAMGHRDGKETVWCLSSETGAVLWTHVYPSKLLPNLHEGGPCATPTIDGDVVYTVGKEGQLFCLAVADGSIVWQVMLQDDLGVKLPEWGFSSSPLVLGEQLILEAGRVVSYSKRDGKRLWQTAKHSAGYGSAAPFEWQEQTLLATLDCEGLRVLDSGDGTELAFTPWKSPYETNSTTPIVSGNKIFISTGYNVGCGLFEFTGSQLNAVYTNSDMRNHFNNCVLIDGFLYGIDGNSHNGRNATLSCLNFSTGQLVWKQRGLGCGSLIAADGKLFVLAEQGPLVMVRQSSQEYVELDRTEFLEGRCWTAPALADGRLYGRNASGQLRCVRLP